MKVISEPPSPCKRALVISVNHGLHKSQDDDLKDAFKGFACSDASVILDKMTQRPRGFGFVWFRVSTYTYSPFYWARTPLWQDVDVQHSIIFRTN